MYRRVGDSEPYYYTYNIPVNTYLQTIKEGTVVKYFLEIYGSARLSFKPLVNRRETQSPKKSNPITEMLTQFNLENILVC